MQDDSNGNGSDRNIRLKEAKQIFESACGITLKGTKDSKENAGEMWKPSTSVAVTTDHNSTNSNCNGDESLRRRLRDSPNDWRHKFSIPDHRESSVAPEQFKSQKTCIVEWFNQYSEVQKNLLLTGLLDMCNLPQMHLLSIRLEENLHKECPPNCKDWISWLPETVALKIFSYLDPVSLCRASRCCWSWYELCADPCLWRTLCRCKFYMLTPSLLQTLVTKHTLKRSGDVAWKKVFAEQFRIINNWRRGRCFVKEFQGHTEGVTCVKFDDKRIVSGSWDTTIKVWNIRSNSVMLSQTLAGHSKTVRCLHLHGNRLVSGSKDSTLKVWDLDNKANWSSIACKATMVGHADTVRCVDVTGQHVVSGSYDTTLKIWDINTGECLNTMSGHEGHVLCVQSNGETIVSGSADKSIKMWNYSGQCLNTLNGHSDAVTCIQFDSQRIISGSFDYTIRFWDMNTGSCTQTIDWISSEGHTRIVRCIQADDRRLMSGSDDRTIKVWNLETGKRLVTLRSSGGGVTCLQFNDTKVVSGSYDHRVLLWDFAV